VKGKDEPGLQTPGNSGATGLAFHLGAGAMVTRHGQVRAFYAFVDVNGMGVGGDIDPVEEAKRAATGPWLIASPDRLQNHPPFSSNRNTSHQVFR
jgi:hypothetical protein